MISANIRKYKYQNQLPAIAQLFRTKKKMNF